VFWTTRSRTQCISPLSRVTFFSQISDTGRIHVRGGGGVSSLFDEYRVVTVAMTSRLDGRSRFPRRRGPLLLLLLLLQLFVYKPRPPAVLPVITRESLLRGLRYSRGLSSWWETWTVCFYFFRHCGTVAQSHCCCHHALSFRRRVVSYPFLFLLLFSSCVDVVVLLSTGVLIKKPVRHRFTGITSVAFVFV